MNVKPPLKILRIVSRLNIGGPAQHVIFLTRFLNNEHWQTELVSGVESRAEGNMLALAEREGVRPVRLSMMKRSLLPFRDLLSFVQIFRIIRRYRPDIVHTHTAKAGALGRLAAHLARVPLIVHTFHGHVFSGYFHPLVTAVFVRIERFLARFTDCLISLSVDLDADLKRLRIRGKDGNRIVPLGLDLERFAKAERRKNSVVQEALVNKSALRIGMVGRLVPIKRHALLLEALSKWGAQEPPMEVFFVGDGECAAALKAQTLALGLESKVHFLGFRQDLEEIYPELDLVVLCSANEGMPVCLLEAMACGIPILATRVGGIVNLLSDNPSCKLVGAESVDELQQGLREIIPQLASYRQRAQTHRQTIIERYGMRQLVLTLENLYTEMMEAK